MLVLAGAAAVVFAAQVGAQTKSPADAVRPGAYRLEPVHTQILFGVSHLGFTTYYGEFSGASGTLVLDQANRAASRKLIVAFTARPASGVHCEIPVAPWIWMA